MARPLGRIHDQALKLTEAERARLVTDLLATLEPDVPSQDHSESEWIAEVERRARAAQAGEVGFTWSEARSEIQQKLPNR